jgi:hypothetical protein
MTRLLFLMLISFLTLQGCSEPKRPMMGVYFEGFSHISAPIRNFVVRGNNIGSGIAPYGSGGDKAVVSLYQSNGTPA